MSGKYTLLEKYLAKSDDKSECLKALKCCGDIIVDIEDYNFLSGNNLAAEGYFKDLYQDIKSRVELFAELHGQSEVISKQLALTEE